jgi:hypothetical protein
MPDILLLNVFLHGLFERPSEFLNHLLPHLLSILLTLILIFRL